MMLRAMGLSLPLTELIELSAALLLKKREDIGLIALANLMTNPAVVYLSLLTKALRPGLYPAAAAVAELLAVLAEGYAYKRRAAKIARHTFTDFGKITGQIVSEHNTARLHRSFAHSAICIKHQHGIIGGTG